MFDLILLSLLFLGTRHWKPHLYIRHPLLIFHHHLCRHSVSKTEGDKIKLTVLIPMRQLPLRYIERLMRIKEQSVFHDLNVSSSRGGDIPGRSASGRSAAPSGHKSKLIVALYVTIFFLMCPHRYAMCVSRMCPLRAADLPDADLQEADLPIFQETTAQ